MDAFYGKKPASSEKHQEDSRANIPQEILVVLATLKEAVSLRLSELTPHSLCSAKTRSIQKIPDSEGRYLVEMREW